MPAQYDSPAARILEVLTWFAKHPGRPVSDLCRGTGLTKSTAHRIVDELERLGWLAPAPAKKGPIIGARGIEMAKAAMEQRVASIGSATILQNLSDKLGETCTLALQDGPEVRFIESVSPQGSFAYVYPVADRSPLFCSSSGRVLLAEWPQAALDKYLANTPREAFTAHTVTDEDALRDIIREVKESGYAWTYQQWVPNVVGAAVPVRAQGRCVAVLSFNAPDNRVGPDDISQFVLEMQAAAQKLGQEFMDY